MRIFPTLPSLAFAAIVAAAPLSGAQAQSKTFQQLLADFCSAGDSVARTKEGAAFVTAFKASKEYPDLDAFMKANPTPLYEMTMSDRSRPLLNAADHAFSYLKNGLERLAGRNIRALDEAEKAACPAPIPVWTKDGYRDFQPILRDHIKRLRQPAFIKAERR
jgi:hypothetical protein